MDILKEKVSKLIANQQQVIKDLLSKHGTKVIDSVTISQIYGGMRDISGLITETSLLDPAEGIKFRGYSLPELSEKLPKAIGGQEPLPEAIFWLMLTGEVPTYDEALVVTHEWQKRSNVPKHVFYVIDSMPPQTHPMTQFSVAIMAMQTDSEFNQAYARGASKQSYWTYTYEDVMNLIARLPVVASYIYRRIYKSSKVVESDNKLDWAANFANMLDVVPNSKVEQKEKFHDLMRLYMTIHSDHEGGNVSAHTCHLVGSALSDPYLAFSAAMNGLAGPLHGLANQEVMQWISDMLSELGTRQPTNEQIQEYVENTIDNGRVVPGYGHAVLRITDPRFTAQMEFAKRNGLSEDPFVKVVWKIYDIVPKILSTKAKIKNPWPNVDAHSGAILQSFGLREYSFYTVLFGVSRSLGVLSQLVLSRGLGFPIERPRSFTTEYILKNFSDDNK